MYTRDATHITICSKNLQQAQQKTHEAAHGYTKSLKDAQLVRFWPSRVAKLDSTQGRPRQGDLAE